MTIEFSFCHHCQSQTSLPESEQVLDQGSESSIILVITLPDAHSELAL